VGRLVVSRLGSMLAVLFTLSIVVFLLRAVLPSDPVRAMIGANASAEQVSQARDTLGLDQPLWRQYVTFLGQVFHGDLGTSLRTRRPVLTDIGTFGPATLELALFAFGLAVVFAITFAYFSSLGQRSSVVPRYVALALASTPQFLLVILLLIVFYSHLGWIPAGSRLNSDLADPGPTGLLVLDSLVHADIGLLVNALWHLAMPGLVLAIGASVAIGRVLRGSLLDTRRETYAVAAESRGMSHARILARHGLRNAAGPALSMAGLQAGVLVTGVVVVETMTGWDGLGRYLAQSIQFNDYPAITGVVLALGVFYVFVNMAVDIGQAIADPRLRETLA
jgi:peptide/nickel transport system permease protein